MKRDPLANPRPLIERVYAYVAYRVGAGADAEDVTSETFARALRYRDSFDGGRGDVVPWLLGIARRCIAAHYADSGMTGGEPPDLAGEDRLADDVAQRLDVAHAVATLDERDRELVALRYGADLTAAQIATVLELRVNTVEVALHRLLARLRVELAPDPPAEASRAPQPAHDA